MIDNKKIVFVAHSGKQIDCNPFAIFKGLYQLKRDQLKYVWLVKKDLINKFKSEFKDYKNFNLVDYDSKKAVDEINSAAVFINNQLMIKHYNEGVRKKAGQLFINTWHGSFGLKKIPLRDNLRTIKDSCFEFDYFISNSKFESKVYQDSFGKNVVALPLGHPRNDYLFEDHSTDKIKQKLGIPKDKKIILWMPSARDAFFADNFRLNIEGLKKTLMQRFGGDWSLLYRFHRNNLDDYDPQDFNNCIDVSLYPNLNELLVASDILVSDYSSVICDYILLRKPVFVYAPDYQQFISFNPLYWDFNQLPFGKAETSEELSANILKFDSEEYLKGIDHWLKSVGCIEDGKATERICRIIIEFLAHKCDYLLKFTNILSPTLASFLGFKEIFFTFRNLGDQLILQRALTIYKEKNKLNKVLVGTLLPELWNQSNSYLVRLKEEKLHCYTKDLFNQFNELHIETNFLSQEKLIPHGSSYIRTYGPFHIVGNVASKLGISGSIDVNLNLDLSDEEKEFGRFYPLAQKQIAVMTGGLQRYKTYATSKMQWVVDRLTEKGFNVIQVGVIKDPLLQGVLDLRGKLNLREVAATLYNSDIFIGGIGGLMHLANSVGCPSVVIYTSAEPNYIVNYDSNINVGPSGDFCSLCQKGLHCPWTNKCKATDPKLEYSCIDNIKPEDILEAAITLLSRVRNKIKSDRIILAHPVHGLTDYYKTGFKLIESGSNRNQSIIRRIFNQESYKLRADKVCTRYYFFNQPLISKIESSNLIKYRIMFMNLYFRKKETIKGQPLETQHYKIKAGNQQWIKSVENFPPLLSKYVKYFEDKDLETLALALKRKRSAYIDRTTEFEPLDSEIQSQSDVNEYKFISDQPVGTYFNEGIKKSIYQYGRFFTDYKVGSLFGFYHHCFIDDYKQCFKKGSDVLDVGAGVGDTSLIFNHYLKATTYALEPCDSIFTFLEENISINNAKLVIPHKVALWDKEKIIYLTNKTNTLNAVVKDETKGSIPTKASTVDLFVKKNQINPGLIKIMTNWGESNILKGSLNTIQKFRPIVIVSLSASGKELFSIFEICTNFSNYRFHIRKTSELHSTDGMFLICIPNS